MSRRRWQAALRRRLRPIKRISMAPSALALDCLLRCTAWRLGVVIVLHRVGDPAGDPETELVPAMGTGVFRGELQLLRRRFVVVPSAELLGAASARRRFQRFPVALTFDDDWSGHVLVSMPLLAETGARATFFLGGATLQQAHSFWFDLLQSAYDRGLLGPPSAIHEEAARMQALPATRRQARAQELALALGPDQIDAGLRARDVRRLVEDGHEIGFHTRAHETLTTLGDAELQDALEAGRKELEDVAGAPITAIAYPGGQADAHVVERARATGFLRGYSTMPYPVGEQSDPLWLGRVYASLESPARMSLEISRALRARRLAAEHPQAAPAGE